MSYFIQGYKISSSVCSLDFNAQGSFFIAGGRDVVQILSFDERKDYWFQCRNSVTSHRNTTIRKMCVRDLSWNKFSAYLVAMGTSTGYVFVYDVEHTCKSIFQMDEHKNNINNVVWLPESNRQFFSSSIENTLIHWDISMGKMVSRVDYHDQIKIRSVKCNPREVNYIAVQSATMLNIYDRRRNLNDAVMQKIVDSSELQGNVVEWDPYSASRIASNVSKQILIYSTKGSSLQPEESFSHYSLIKSMKWMKTKVDHFGISGENPDRNISFYDLANKDRVAYIYGGHNQYIDCWTTNLDQSFILSASSWKDKKGRKDINSAINSIIVAQKVGNFIDPNQQRLIHPLSFDCNSSLAMPISASSQGELSSKKGRVSHEFAFIHKITPSTIKEEITFLHQNYIVDGSNEEIEQHNAKAALKIGKQLCKQLWEDLFILAFPPKEDYHTVESLFETKYKPQASFIDYRIVLHHTKDLIRPTEQVGIEKILQRIVDENELQTAVFAAICLLRKDPEIISIGFLHTILTPYIDLLRSLELYVQSIEIIQFTKIEQINKSISKRSLFNVVCERCKLSMTKNRCKCDLICVLCEKPLIDKIVLWCKFCGHGGHAEEYKKHFEKEGAVCPYGRCEHICFWP